MRKLLLIMFVVLGLQQAMAQTFQVDADIRQRGEYSHGFGNLATKGMEPGFFVEQRSRLNTSYTNEKLTAYISFQDVSTWGATPQIDRTDADDSFNIAQAWVQMNLTPKIALKLGRQPLSYDDQRILGGLDWAMQGRFHDAGLIRFKHNKLTIDGVGAFNQATPSRVGTDYTITSLFSYKTMQMVHANYKTEKITGSFLILNNGFQKYDYTKTPKDPDGLFYRRTIGLFLDTKPVKNLSVTASAYSQTGKSNETTGLNAFNAAIDAMYKITPKVSFGLGYEMLSGDKKSTKDQNAFFPVYGTNHAFNGYMDYFYVGNHANSVGLNDLHAKVTLATGAKSKVAVNAHYFKSNTSIAGSPTNDLGTEIDVVFTTPIIKDVMMNIGYSQLFAEKGMEVLKKATNPSGTNNWAWVMFVIKPTLFKSEVIKPAE